MKGARQLCGMYDTSANVQRPCVSCYCSYEDLGNTSKKCKPVLDTRMKEAIHSGDQTMLQSLSQHFNSKNAFFDLNMGGWKYGIWGLCPSEVLHQFFEGVLLYALEEFMLNVLTPTYRENLTTIMQKVINACKNLPNRDAYPSGTFTMGITKLKTMKGIEKFGTIFYLALFLNMKISRTEFFLGVKEMKTEMKKQMKDWKKLFELSCYYHDWSMQKTYSRKELLGKRIRIVEYYQLFKKLVTRKGKGIQTIPKFHEFFHVIDNIIRHGPPAGYSTLPTESNHRPIKIAAQHTQRQAESFSFQSGERVFEMNVISSTYDFVKGFASSNLYLKNEDKKSTTTPVYQKRQGVFYAKYHIETKKVVFLYDNTKADQIKNKIFSDKLSDFFVTNLFSLMDETKSRNGYFFLPCFTTMIRKGISFRGLSRDQFNYPGWASFQWSLNNSNDSTILCPGKIMTFVDFTGIDFQEKFAHLYPKNEWHTIIHSLQSTPSDSFNGHHAPICTQATLENVVHQYHCVSTNTIYDSAFVIPDFGSNNERKYLYVHSRGYNNADDQNHDDNELKQYWSDKF